MIAIEPIDTVPALDLAPQEVDALIEALGAYHAIYSPLFRRREQRKWSQQYMHGLLLELPRKSIEPMVLALEGANRNTVRAMQQFLREGAWEDAALLQRHWQEVARDLGDDDGVLTLDGSDVPKQGTESVGVQRQYGGELGKRANCQAGVFLGYARPQGYTLRDRRLYRPQEWVEDAAYIERRMACGVPGASAFPTKPMLGWAMIQAVQQAGTLRCRWVAGDEAVGRATTLRDHIAGLGLWYDAEVPHDTQVWRERPATTVPAGAGRGRQPTRTQIVAGAPQAQPVALLAAAVPVSRWSRQTIKEGSKGPIGADCVAVRVVAVRDGLPGPEGWLILRRHVLPGELKTSLSNASADTALPTLVRLSGRRWPSETCFEAGQQYLGMGDYEVRAWRGWPHHLTLCLLAHFCLVRLPCRRKKPPRA
jgi:SRSO17 transposase